MDRHEFMLRLAEQIRPRSAQAGTTILRDMLPMLTDLASDVFTESALQYLAAQLPRSPNLAQLRAAFDAYKRAHAPAVALGADDPHVPSRDRFIIKTWNRYRTDGFANGMTPESWLSMIRTIFPIAFERICISDVLAADIAVRRSWDFDYRKPDPPTPEQIERNAETVQQLVGELRASSLFAEPRAKNAQLDALNKPPPVRPYHLTPEQLDQISPLPNGLKRKRTDANSTTPAAVSPTSEAAAPSDDTEPA